MDSRNDLLTGPADLADSLALERLAAIVSSSDDIIISKTLDGTITSWNASATRILGYDEAEMIGQPILRIIPPEFAHEEAEFIDKIRQGKRVEHFDTQRLRKDGTRVHLSLTLSPLRDRTGRVVGASKVARDITERKRAEELQRTLFNELNHRVKNTLAIIQAIAAQSLRRATSTGDFVISFNGRIQALARAHDLLVQGSMKEARMADLVQEQVILGRHDPRIFVAGPEVRLNSDSTIDIALLLHELASNARKHGGLSIPTGSLDVRWRIEDAPAQELVIDWREGGMTDLAPPARTGFGSTLIQNALAGKGGATRLEYPPTGLVCQIRFPLDAEERQRSAVPRPGDRRAAEPAADGFAVKGRKILVVEDEMIIAMEITDLLAEAGVVVVGPARTLDEAVRLIETAEVDAALIDANLNGNPVDRIAELLNARTIPFAFCTGYGREALPASGQGSPILAKPFSEGELAVVVNALCGSVGAQT